MTLYDLKDKQTCYVRHVGGSESFELRMEEMGFVPGQEITRLYASPLGAPIVYAMLGQQVALRESEARLIKVCATLTEAMQGHQEQQGTEADTFDTVRDQIRQSSPTAPLKGSSVLLSHRPEAVGVGVAPIIRAAACDHSHCAGCSGCAPRRPTPEAEPDELTLALIGNPNCGKTAYFNAASGGHERTGNYAGITVTSVVGRTTVDGQRLRVVDLPGTYSLKAFSPEEAYVAATLASGKVDVIVNILDVNNLERNLLLTLQLQEKGLPIVGVLNIYDEFQQGGSLLDTAELSRRMHMPFVPCVARSGQGVEQSLREAIKLGIAHRTDVRRTTVGAPDGSDAAVEGARASTARSTSADLEPVRLAPPTHRHLDTGRAPSTKHAAAHAHSEIHRLLEGIYTLREGRAARLTTRIDRWLTARWVAFPLFFLILWLIFFATFQVGAYPMEWMQAGVDWLSQHVAETMPHGWLRDMLCDGIIAGVGAVIVFLPNILILYFFISVLEDSGYLARAAFLADPLLRRVGLHGRSFVPMLMGFGCNVPAVMATRTIDSRKSRLITMMVLPFMSCSARLPVFTMLTLAFFPHHAAEVMLVLYVGGIAVGCASAWALSRVYRRGEQSHLVMEMPFYRRPSLDALVRHTWEKGREYLHKMGGIILVASIGVWALGYFPHHTTSPQTGAPMSAAQQQEASYLGQVGHAMEPVLRPLGFDWRMGVSLVAGVGAKELVMSTLSVLDGAGPDPDVSRDRQDPDNHASSAAAEPRADDPTEKAVITSLRHSGMTRGSAAAFLVFILLYFPCVATIAAIRSESGRWRYAWASALYTTLVAYLAALVVYHVV